MLVFNYTGDRLNFGLATEQARREGRKVRAIGHLGLGTWSWIFYYILERLGIWALGLGFPLISRLFGHGHLHLHLGFYYILGCIGL